MIFIGSLLIALLSATTSPLARLCFPEYPFRYCFHCQKAQNRRRIRLTTLRREFSLVLALEAILTLRSLIFDVTVTLVSLPVRLVSFAERWSNSLGMLRYVLVLYRVNDRFFMNFFIEV